ncbi:hypothetical protein MSIMFI_00716 [Mycobacterium simulans]|uniref:hypothetical protein n=1 Tax=Mycobacterium simulans TaxID=627089 RepID=UPI001749AB06|nr:hypothetical protein [Mycobacterium simulans]SON59234.1 hypothetical protein MSIMFI_00716 [Mycobacterium simulans]
MARYDPPDYGANDPSAYGNYGYGGNQGGYGQQPQPEPTPGWAKPLALVGWGVLIAALIAVIVYGIVELVHGPSPASVITTTTTTPPTTTNSPAPGALPTLPSEITLPSMPTVINLRPGL